MKLRLALCLLVAVVALASTLGACSDLRDFRGAWSGARVGDNPVLRVGIAAEATARLTVDSIDRHGLAGTLDVDGVVVAAPLASLPGAEADALAGLRFDGAPLRVYLGFVASTDGGGDAMALVALFGDERLEVRILRGGGQPLYAIFGLAR